MTIHILSQTLSRQIAAGEIIHCPASVVKELMENSIDAGATNINIDINKGGLQSIIVSDNGHGMEKMDLEISLMRFSTSKIYVLNDLNSIMTLGFRGEALSSISAVSRITLISTSINQEQGWWLYKEASDHSCILKPISHPIGTTIIAADLFYNMPARRNFMKSEKNEFIHIKKIVEKLALSKNTLSVRLKHNNVLVKNYVLANNHERNMLRLRSVFGKCLSEEFLYIHLKYAGMCITGWLFIPEKNNFKKKVNYFYVNHRLVYNNIMQHALNKAIKEMFGDYFYFSAILYLTIPPDQININIHPTKYDLQFYQSRLVHGLIYQAVINVLKKNYSQKNIFIKNITMNNSKLAGNNILMKKNNIQSLDSIKKPIIYNNYNIVKNNIIDNNFFKKDVLFNNFYKSFGYLLSLVNKNYLLIENIKGFFMLSLPMVQRLVQISHMQNTIKDNQELYILHKPYKIKKNITYRSLCINIKKMLLQFGLEICIKDNNIYLYTVPVFLKKQNWKKIFSSLCKYIFLEKDITYQSLLIWLANNIEISIKKWDDISIISMLSEMETSCPKLIKNPPATLLQSINFNKIFHLLKT
ncbi:MAG TPA: DNA mismatch repair endonuclease MutL [Buchnera sp. (in: enterobacteria)]|nr:DNA mismatch repair endonuclease MutL [Buchnera sp. (in: enterobacteria)]